MKVCVIGNSHASMLVAATGLQPGFASFTFFAKPRLTEADFTQNGSLITTQDASFLEWLARFGTAHTVDLADFDAVIIVGLSASLHPVARIFQSHLVTGWPSGLRRLVAGLENGDGQNLRPPVTRGTFRAMLAAINRQNLTYAIARELRQSSQIPLLIVPQPFPSAQLMQSSDFPVIRAIARQKNGAAVAEDLAYVYRDICAELGNAFYVTQPASTISNGCLTKAEHMRGARRLNMVEDQPPEDIWHGNDGLGSAILARIKDILSDANA